MYSLKIKFSDNATDEIKEYYSNFKNHHVGDSGIDLINPNTVNVSPFEVGCIDFNIKCEMRDMNDNLVSYYLYPRSSISKTPFMLANNVGIIDAGYRGNIIAKIRNLSLENSSTLQYEKLFQICSPDLKPIVIEIVDDLSNSSRGDGSFGSTNV